MPEANILTISHDETRVLLVRVPGTDAAARPILFSTHMDVVDARPEDSERSPFTLIEEKGMFYSRGTSDNKAGVASMLSNSCGCTRTGVRCGGRWCSLSSATKK